MEEIEYNGKKLAFIIRKHEKIEDKKFFSSNEDYLQVGYMCLKSGEKIIPHIHKEFKREVYRTQEVLYIIKGIVKVVFYEDRRKIDEVNIGAGDLIVLLNGGHGFEFLEETMMIEVKQGPYIDSETDKEKFLV